MVCYKRIEQRCSMQNPRAILSQFLYQTTSATRYSPSFLWLLAHYRCDYNRVMSKLPLSLIFFSAIFLFISPLLSHFSFAATMSNCVETLMNGADANTPGGCNSSSQCPTA